MSFRKGIPKLAFLSIALFSVVLAACGGGVSQGDYDAAKQQLASEQQKAAALQQQLSAKLAEANDLQSKLTEAQKSKLPAGASVLLAAGTVPTPTPRPTPTPPPPGFTPAPPPVPPASFAEPLTLYIYADTVTAAANESRYSVDATGIKNWACVQTSVFKRGMHVVWRYEVVDIATGKRLTGNEVATAAVRLPTGETINGRFGRHGSTADAPWFWTSAWDIPLDYALGTLDWSIAVTTKDGKNGAFKPWVVSIPERAVESRLQILE